jgi:hypothetical protein
VVTVFARAAGVEVRTTARAKDEGSAGQVIAVEVIGERQSFLARVSGPQEVEVLAASAGVEPEPAAMFAMEATAPDRKLDVEAPSAARSAEPTAPLAGERQPPRGRSSWLKPIANSAQAPLVASRPNDSPAEVKERRPTFTARSAWRASSRAAQARGPLDR